MENDPYRKWIEYQKAPEMKWLIIEIDHVKPICMFDVSNGDVSKGSFLLEKTQPLLEGFHQRKVIKYKFLENQLQFIKKSVRNINLSNYMKKGPRKILIDKMSFKPPRKNYPTKKMIYNHIDEKWSIILASFSDFKNSNNKGCR